jgi:hypothetical protein
MSKLHYFVERITTRGAINVTDGSTCSCGWQSEQVEIALEAKVEWLIHCAEAIQRASA